MIHVGRLAPGNQWDSNMLDQLFANELYQTGLDFKRVDGYPDADGCVLIIPGRYHYEKTNLISENLAKYRWVLAIRAGDEENLFDPEKVVHPHLRWWVQTPKVGFDYPQGSRLFGVGYPKHLNHPKHQERDTDSFISAQRTHQRRVECFLAMNDVRGVKQVQATQGFTQGMDPDEYALWMAATKTAPCPSGPESPDSFRAYEALQAHAVPIVDDITPAYDSAGYWNLVHPDAPFPILSKWEQLPGYTQDVLKRWPANANRITAWWMREKRKMAHWLVEDLTDLGAL